MPKREAQRLKHDGFRASAGPDFQETLGLALGHGDGGDALSRNVADDEGAVGEELCHILVGNRCALRKTESGESRRQVDRLGYRNDLHATMNHLSQSLGAVDARKVEHEEQRSGVVGALHEAKSFLVAQLFDQSPCQPCGEALGKRSSLNAGFHIAEGELLFHLDGTVKREVRKPLCLRGKRANDLDALIDRHMVGLLQVEDLAERHAERIAHIRLDILGVGENGIDELVERALAGNDP